MGIEKVVNIDECQDDSMKTEDRILLEERVPSVYPWGIHFGWIKHHEKCLISMSSLIECYKTEKLPLPDVLSRCRDPQPNRQSLENYTLKGEEGY